MRKRFPHHKDPMYLRTFNFTATSMVLIVTNITGKLIVKPSFIFNQNKYQVLLSHIQQQFQNHSLFNHDSFLLKIDTMFSMLTVASSIAALAWSRLESPFSLWVPFSKLLIESKSDIPAV